MGPWRGGQIYMELLPGTFQPFPDNRRAHVIMPISFGDGFALDLSFTWMNEGGGATMMKDKTYPPPTDLDLSSVSTSKLLLL